MRDAVQPWAAEVADRRLAAQAIARAGLTRANAISPRPVQTALGAVDTGVSDGANAFLAPVRSRDARWLPRSPNTASRSRASPTRRTLRLPTTAQTGPGAQVCRRRISVLTVRATRSR